MEEIVRYDFVLYALFDLGPIKRFECRSDVWVLTSVGDSVSILNLLNALELGDGKWTIERITIN